MAELAKAAAYPRSPPLLLFFLCCKCPSPLLTAKLLLFAVALFLLPLSLFLLTTTFSSSSHYHHPSLFFYPRSQQIKHPPFFLSSHDALAFPVLRILQRRSFNSTLLDVAKVDLWAPEEQKQIDLILDESSWSLSGSSSSSALSKSMDRLERSLEDYSWGRYNGGGGGGGGGGGAAAAAPSRDGSRYNGNGGESRRQRSRPWTYSSSSGSRNRLPLQLMSPRLEAYRAEFQQLLREWVRRKKAGHEEPQQVMGELLRLVKEPMDRAAMEARRRRGKSGDGDGDGDGDGHGDGDGDGDEEGLVVMKAGNKTRKYRSCAVVGNSGILLNQSFGHLIDGHEMVMRLNNARIRGFEDRVGSRTSVAFVNSNVLHACARRGLGCSSAACQPYRPDVPIVMYICQVVHFMDVAECGPRLEAPLIVTDARFDTLCARIAKYYSLKLFSERFPGRDLALWARAHDGPLFHYSSGMQAVLLAVGICDRVSLFGFGKSDSARHHYHSMQKEELRLHDYAAEYEFYNDLSSRDPLAVPFLHLLASSHGFSIPPVHIYW